MRRCGCGSLVFGVWWIGFRPILRISRSGTTLLPRRQGGGKSKVDRKDWRSTQEDETMSGMSRHEADRAGQPECSGEISS